MKKFINKLYEYYKTHSNIHEVSIDDSSGNPILDNVYAKAVCYEFGNVVVPTRMSELEDLAYSVARILETMGYQNGDKMPVDSNAQKFYNALCCCLIYVDYEAARYNYDFNDNYNLSIFYTICNGFHIQYNRWYYTLSFWGDDIGIFYYDYGFKVKYVNSGFYDDAFEGRCAYEDDYAFAFNGQILLKTNYEIIYKELKVEDWLANPIIKSFWDKIPNKYIREHYRDTDFYENLKNQGSLQLLAMYIDAIRLEVNEVDENIEFKLADIERSLGRSRFINAKLISAYKLTELQKNDLDIEEKYEWFVSRSDDLSALVYVFPSYADVIRKAIIAASKK